MAQGPKYWGFPCVLEVLIPPFGNEALYTEQIGKDRIFVESERTPPVGTLLPVIVGMLPHFGEPIQFAAAVREVRHAEDRWGRKRGIELAFLNLQPLVREQCLRMIRSISHAFNTEPRPAGYQRTHSGSYQVI